MYADLVLHNGNIITLNEEQPSASVIACKGGKILKVGNYNEVKPLLDENRLPLVGQGTFPCGS